MNISAIHLLQEKYPNKTLIVLDIRTATIHEAKASTGKDIAFTPMVVRARKPRSRDTVDLLEFDEQLEMFLCVENKTVYYMPTGYNRYCAYTTNVFATGDMLEDVAQMVQMGMSQNVCKHGTMKRNETRMFCLRNEQSRNPYPLIHVTMHREAKEYRIAAELHINNSNNYTTMLSIGIPATSLQ